MRTCSRRTRRPTPTSKHPPPPPLTPLSLAKIDKKAIRNWRQAHPKRYHPPSIASHATARSQGARSVAPSVHSRLRQQGPTVVADEAADQFSRTHSHFGQAKQRRRGESCRAQVSKVSLEQQLMAGGNPVHTLKQKRHN